MTGVLTLLDANRYGYTRNVRVAYASLTMNDHTSAGTMVRHYQSPIEQPLVALVYQLKPRLDGRGFRSSRMY